MTEQRAEASFSQPKAAVVDEHSRHHSHTVKNAAADFYVQSDTHSSFSLILLLGKHL